MLNIKKMCWAFRLFFCFFFASYNFLSHAMTQDNRWIPLYYKPELGFDGRRGSFNVDAFIATASEATIKEKTVGIPALSGNYNEGTYADGLAKAGCQNPLPTEWQGKSIPWFVGGKIQAQAVAFAISTPLGVDWITTGCNWFFMRVNTYQTFALERTELQLGAGDAATLDALRRAMFDSVGLVHNHGEQAGFSDIDWYLRFGYHDEYVFKCRTVDTGVRVGVLFPSGVQRDLSSPSSIPFGGNGHWGAYATVDGLFEVREDMKVGLWARFSKRFPKTSFQRLPVNGEPDIFGITTGQARVNPGFTFILSPCVALENLRGGMGASLHYTLTKHMKDSWQDERCDKTIPVDLCKVEELSDWGSDYFTLNVFYDFGKVKVERSFDPVISFRWDIPAMLYMTDKIPKTQRVSLGIEWVF